MEPETTVQEQLPTIGKLLRTARKGAGVSLEAAAEATKISRSCLRSLEGDRLQEFSSLAYLKGFIRTYSEYLNLDPEEMLLLLEKQPTSFADEGISGGLHPPPVKSFLQRFALPVSLFVILLLSTLFFSPTYLPRSSKVAVTKSPEPIDLGQGVMQPHSSAAVRLSADPEQMHEERPVQKEPEPVVTPQQQHTDGFQVRMKVKRNCQLVVLIDGATSQRYELTAGDIIEWKATRTITLDISDGDAVELERDGQPFRFQGVAGRPAWVELDAEGGGAP